MHPVVQPKSTQDKLAEVGRRAIETRIYNRLNRARDRKILKAVEQFGYSPDPEKLHVELNKIDVEFRCMRDDIDALINAETAKL